MGILWVWTVMGVECYGGPVDVARAGEIPIQLQPPQQHPIQHQLQAQPEI